MASLNKVTIIGNLGRDPESRTFPSGDRTTSITVATTDRWKDKQTGEMKEATEWHRIQFFGRLAEIADQYLRKGAQVYVEGSLRTRKWTDKDGVDKYVTEIRADQMQMLGAKPAGDDQRGRGDDRRGDDRGGRDDRGRGYDDRGGNDRGSNDRGGYRENDGYRGGHNEQSRDDRRQGGGNDRGGDDRGGRAPAPARSPAPAPARAPAPPARGGATGFDDMDDDIPFATAGFSADPMVADRKGKRLGRTSF